jgi:amidophosphoribosyltransferase
MAANNTIDEIRQYLNADSLHYLSQEGMIAATGQKKDAFCLACYDGNYPVAYDPLLDKHIIERRRKHTQTLGEAATKESEQIRLLPV